MRASTITALIALIVFTSCRDGGGDPCGFRDGVYESHRGAFVEDDPPGCLTAELEDMIDPMDRSHLCGFTCEVEGYIPSNSVTVSEEDHTRLRWEWRIDTTGWEPMVEIVGDLRTTNADPPRILCTYIIEAEAVYVEPCP